MRRIDVVTVARSDWGIWRPVLQRLQREDVSVRLLVGGAHLLTGNGRGVADIVASKLGDVVEVPMSAESDTPLDVAQTIGRGVAGFASCFAAQRPDIVLVLGDRFEMFAAAVAAVPFVLPIAHLHGGERTGGAIDDAFRHAITKMSHLHFVSTRAHGDRVRQLGEEAWRVTVSGAPALDAFLRSSPVDDDALTACLGVDARAPFALCTFHPTTLQPGSAERQSQALLEALARVEIPVVFTMPNADTGGLVIRAAIEHALRRQPTWRAHESLGHAMYGAALARAAVVVGNSSSGIIEAPAFGVPIVNIGERQDGRERAASVVDVTNDADAIVAAVRAALTPAARAAARACRSPYGDGHAADRIVERLLAVALDDTLTRKGFVDIAHTDEGTHAA
ncbi:MAG TPA: UDP-N-acetylglucosamine 2-epimerase [Myxococcota bacterium]